MKRQKRTLVLLLTLLAALIGAGLTLRARPQVTETFVPVLQSGASQTVVCFDTICPDNVPERFDSAYLLETTSRLNRLYETQEFTPEERASCHVITHSLGKGAVRSGLSVDLMLEAWTPVCVNGYPHGLIEELANGRTDAELDALTDELCARVPKASLFSCVHGYGHAIAAQDLSYSEETVGRCKRFPTSTALACTGGWFMRIAQSMPRPLPADVDAADLSLVCSGLGGELAEACSYQMWMVYVGRYSGAELLDVCNLMSRELVGHCVRGYGALSYYTWAMPYIKTNDELPSDLAPGCEKLAGTREHCLFGMLRSRAATWSSNGYRKEDFLSLCSTTAVARKDCEEAEESGLTA